MNRSRWLLLVLPLVVMTGLAVRQTVAQQPVTVQITSASGGVGDTVTVRLSILDLPSPGLGAFTVDVHYDPAIVTAVSPCTTNPENTAGLSIICNRAYDAITVRVGGFSSQITGPTGDLALADINFSIVGGGVSDLTPVVQELVDPVAQPIDYVVQGGTITASGTITPGTPTSTPTPTLTPTITRTPTVTRTPTGEGPKLAIDMVKDGDSWCDPVDSSATHDQGEGPYQVAICLLDCEVPAADFNVELRYDSGLNSCTNTGQTGAALNANPDFIGDLTVPSPTWNCSAGGFRYPECGEGTAFITCSSIDELGTISGPWPIAVVTFNVVGGGVDSLSFGVSAAYNSEGDSIVRCPESGLLRCLGATDVKVGPSPTSTATPTITATVTSTPWCGGVGQPACPTSTPTRRPYTRTPTPMPPTSTPAAPTATKTPTPRACLDLNGDGKVDGKDVSIVARALFTHPGMRRWNAKADVNGDGKVNLCDLFLVIKSSHDRDCQKPRHHHHFLFWGW